MYTKKEYRRKEIADTLFEKVMEEARSSGCGMIQIAAWDNEQNKEGPASVFPESSDVLMENLL